MSAYETLFRRVLFPFYESGLRRRGTLRYFDEYERNQWLTPDEIAALQWSKLKRLVEHCYRDVPYYGRTWDALGIRADDIQTLADYARLPTLTKADIRANFDDLVATSWRDRMLYKATGGSTGEPLRFGYTRESNERRTAVMWRGYGWAGARMGRRTLYLWGGAVGNPGRAQLFKDRMYHAAFGRRMLDSFPMSESNMSEYADAIDAYKPEIIVAYVGPLVRLAEWLLATGRRVHAPEALLGGAEALLEYQRDIIRRAFGAPAFNTYGCREFMLIASECERRDGLHVNADHLVVETVGGGNGAAGDVCITDLSNFGMPFIRYLNGDLATPATRTCSCGRGLPLIERVDGRKLDAIRTRDGHILPGEFFPHMLKDIPGLRRFQVVQRSLDRIDIALVATADFKPEGLDYARREIGKVLGDATAVEFAFVDEIKTSANGKFRVTISELTENGQGMP
ncbi:MAG TPA: phenylacetate--CoA ligase family protein [Rhodanobacteraceae bacterium]|nr:phenylacetate--CoA ligase family protein [Rhodanobacteraceae bacterium]